LVGEAYAPQQSTAASIVGVLASRSRHTLRRMSIDCATMDDVHSCLLAARVGDEKALPALEHFQVGLFATPSESFEATLLVMPPSLRSLSLRYMLGPPSLITLARDLPILRQSCSALDRLELAPHCCGRALDDEWEAARGAVSKACEGLSIRLAVSDRRSR